MRYGLGLGVIEVDLSHSSLFDRFHFRVGEAIGGSLQAAMLLESGVVNLARATALGVKDLSQGLLSRYGFWGKGVLGGKELLSQSAIRSRILSNIAETRVGIKTSNFGVHTAIQKVPYLNVSTGLDEAIFWSGRGNRELAETFAGITTKRTIEMTPGGQYLDSLKLFNKFPYEQARIPWERLSERFAQNAFGDVYAFVTGSSPSSIFRTVELPVLLRNPNVSEIIYSPVYEYKNVFNFVK